MGSSQTRARTRVPCIGRQILNHCATREAQIWIFWLWNTSSQAYISVKDYRQSERAESQVNFSAFLCMWRCKNPGSLKFFLRYASSPLGACLSKAECLIQIFHPEFSSGWAVSGWLLWVVTYPCIMSYALLFFFVHTFKDFFLCFTIMDLDINFIMLSILGLLHFQSEYLYSLLILENSAIISWNIVPFFLYFLCCLLLQVLWDIHGRPLCLYEVHMCRAPGLPCWPALPTPEPLWCRPCRAFTFSL